MFTVSKLRTPLIATTLILLGFGSCLHSQHTYAQDSKTTKYQIELIVFKRGYFQDGQYSDQESWPKDVHLDYPEKVLHLLNNTQFNETVSDYEKHANIYGLNADDIKKLVQQNTVYPLPLEQRSLRREARRISARSEIDILFHEAWIQDIVNKENASALVIKGGSKFGNHYQLEGSINLTRSRFLHADTKLWLTNFGNTYKQLSNGQRVDHWPPLPKTPSPLGASYNVSEFGDNSSSLPRDVINISNYDSVNSSSDTIYSSSSDPYYIQNIVSINQKKKMRSNEIHYLDHPLMGAIIMIRPLESIAENNAEEK